MNWKGEIFDEASCEWGSAFIPPQGSDGPGRLFIPWRHRPNGAARSLPSVWTVRMPEDRSFALLIRVWFEDQADNLRARVTALAGSSEHDECERKRIDMTIAIATTPCEAVDSASEWLDVLLHHGFNPH